MSILGKIGEATEAYLDGIIQKSKVSSSSGVDARTQEYSERKAQVDLIAENEQTHGYKEKTGLVGPAVLKNMARKDSIVAAIISTRLAQVAPFLKPQKDKYSPGWEIQAVEPADISAEDKLRLSDPSIKTDEEYAELKFELDQKRQKLKEKQDKERDKVKQFIAHCGMPAEETDTTHHRWDFDKFVKTVVQDRLIYNYAAIELIPTKDGDSVHHFYPVSSGTIRYVSAASAEDYKKQIEPVMEKELQIKKRFDPKKPFRYVQVVRGRIVAAFTEDELIFEPAIPTVDPEDQQYSQGELETLIQTVTAHLFAEAHNKNFFTQGIGTKGLLHIKGDNISRAQLEAFKRTWQNQVVNSRNAFRPPIIGMAEDVKWVDLAQSNRDMEFDNWMHYLIKVICSIFQIDPAEINFDISKGSNASTLQEANNEEKLKSSRDKGLRPLLDYVENLVNNHILRYWDKDLANKYKFKFVGYDAESRRSEQERLQKETSVWKTLNEARVEMGFAPLEDGDIVLNAMFTQYKQTKVANAQAAEQNSQSNDMQDQGEEAPADQSAPSDEDQEIESFTNDLSQALSESEKSAPAPEEAKKSLESASIIEYYFDKE